MAFIRHPEGGGRSDFLPSRRTLSSDRQEVGIRTVTPGGHPVSHPAHRSGQPGTPKIFQMRAGSEDHVKACGPHDLGEGVHTEALHVLYAVEYALIIRTGRQIRPQVLFVGHCHDQMPADAEHAPKFRKSFRRKVRGQMLQPLDEKDGPGLARLQRDSVQAAHQGALEVWTARKPFADTSNGLRRAIDALARLSPAA